MRRKIVSGLVLLGLSVFGIVITLVAYHVSPTPKLIFHERVMLAGVVDSVEVWAWQVPAGSLLLRLMLSPEEENLVLEVQSHPSVRSKFEIQGWDTHSPNLKAVNGGHNQVVFDVTGNVTGNMQVTFTWDEDRTSGTWHW